MAILWLAGLAVVILILVVGDIRSRELDNRLVLLFTVLVAVAPLVSDRGDDAATRMLLSAGVGTAAFVVGLVMYGLGTVGAGDVKLAFGIAAVVTWFGSTAWLVYLGCAIVAILATLLVLLRRQPGDESQGVALGPGLLAGVVPAVALAQFAG